MKDKHDERKLESIWNDAKGYLEMSKKYECHYWIEMQDKGKVSALEARLKAEGEYEVYRRRQDAEYISDFDREIKRIEGRKS